LAGLKCTALVSIRIRAVVSAISCGVIRVRPGVFDKLV
jgi:hypothetical protein